MESEQIIQIASSVTGVMVEDILSQNRHLPFADARKIAMSLCRDYTNSNWIGLAKIFKRDHSTVIVACRKTKIYLQVDDVFAEKYLKCQRQLRLLGMRKVNRVKK
jgi:chromosomal replication initiator protein